MSKQVDGNTPAAPRWEDPRLPSVLAIVGAVALYVVLPEQLSPGPRWLLPALECCLLVVLAISSPYRESRHRSVRRGFFVVVGLLELANVGSLTLLTRELLHHSKFGGSQLFFAAVEIYLTNILVFALWFWELDRGGPVARAIRDDLPDFLFPQMTAPHLGPEDWQPGFIDYLYVSFTNATAFSPTDTMPLTAGAKTLMALESIAALLTVSMVAARAVNILS